MEPETLPIENALEGLAVLSLIPVAIFALWADYFGKYIDQLTIQNPKFDRRQEVEKIRIGSFFVILFQCTLFVGSGDIQSAFPFLTQLLFVFTLFLQIFIQYKTEKKVALNEEKSLALFRFAARVGVAWILGGTLYAAILISCIKISSLIAGSVHASPTLGTGILLIGGIIGAILGFSVNFGLGPLFLKLMLPFQPIADLHLQSKLKQCFSESGIPIPNFYIIETNSLRLLDIFISGFKHGKWMFKPAIFISKQTLHSLDDRELNAIIKNQISHITLKHLPKRFIFTLILILGTALFSLLAIAIGQLLFPGQIEFEVVGSIVALLSFISSLKYLSKQAKQYELEADIYTVESLKTPLEDFVSALRKLDAPDELSTQPNILSINKGHPDTELRIELLIASLNSNMPSNKEDFPQSKSA